MAFRFPARQARQVHKAWLVRKDRQDHRARQVQRDRRVRWARLARQDRLVRKAHRVLVGRKVLKARKARKALPAISRSSGYRCRLKATCLLAITRCGEEDRHGFGSKSPASHEATCRMARHR